MTEIESSDRRASSPVKVRWLVAATCAFVMFTITSIKVCLSLAVVAMIRNETIPTDNLSGNCSQAYLNALEHLKHHINWSATQKAHMLEAVFWGATVSALPGGRIAERFGARLVIFYTVGLAGVLNLFYPFIAESNYYAAYMVRVVQGICLGVSLPANHVMISRWSPKFEKSLFTSIVNSGGFMANLITHPLVGYLSSASYFGGWPAVFYLIGVLNLIGCTVWYCLVSNDPESHSFISEEEAQEIVRTRTLQSGKHKDKVPWSKIFSSRPILVFFVISLIYGWFLNVISTQLPSFYDDILHLSYEENGFMIALPYLVSIIFSTIAGWVVDRVRREGKISTTMARKIFTFIAFFGAGGCLLAVTISGTNEPIVVTFFTAAKGLSTVILAGAAVTHLDMAPSFAGTLMGISTLLQNFASLLMNETVARLVGETRTDVAWYNFIYLTSGLCLFGAFLYCIFGSARLLPWDPFAISEEEEAKAAKEVNGSVQLAVLSEPIEFEEI